MLGVAPRSGADVDDRGPLGDVLLDQLDCQLPLRFLQGGLQQAPVLPLRPVVVGAGDELPFRHGREAKPWRRYLFFFFAALVFFFAAFRFPASSSPP